MKFGAFASVVICGSLVAACTVTTIHGGDGGDDGSFTSVGNGNGNVTTGGASLCDSAAASIVAKEKQCGLNTTTSSTTSTVASSTSGGFTGGFTTAGNTASSTSSGQSCTPQEGATAQALANCYVTASCGAITGADTTASQALATCLENAYSTTSSTTSGVVTTTTTSNVTSGGGGSCFSPDSPADCGSCNTNASCTGSNACCEMAVPDGIQAVNSILIEACACTSGSTCYSACSAETDICADPNAQPSQTCLSCLQALSGQESCFTTVQSQCASDSTCTDYITCVNSCPTN